MDDIDQNGINNAAGNKCKSKILHIVYLLPKPLKYLFVFATTAFIGSLASYYINPTGLLCGVLAVLVYYQIKW